MTKRSKSSAGRIPRGSLKLVDDKHELATAMATITDPAEIEQLLKDLLTRSELRDLLLRWRLMKMLRNGIPQRTIASQLGISLCKITRGSKLLKDHNSVVSKHLPSTTL